MCFLPYSLQPITYRHLTIQRYVTYAVLEITQSKNLIKLITTKCIYLGNNFGLMADICGYNSAGLDRAGVPLSITTRLALFSKF